MLVIWHCRQKRKIEDLKFNFIYTLSIFRFSKKNYSKYKIQYININTYEKKLKNCYFKKIKKL